MSCNFIYSRSEKNPTYAQDPLKTKILSSTKGGGFPKSIDAVIGPQW
jgi:hypothetical protein